MRRNSTDRRAMLLGLVCVAILALGSSTAGAWDDDDDWPKRVAVVGAGPSGLTAARTLAELGHEAVVFEKENRVGGKVFTVRGRQGKGSQFELGAVILTQDDYPITLSYAQEFGIEEEPFPPARFIVDEFGNKLTVQQFLLSRYTLLEIAAATGNYGAMLAKFSDYIASPGLTNLDPDLSLPFDEFAALYEIEPITELVRSRMIGFGYGYYENVPAAYYVKFMPFLVKVGPGGLEPSTPYFFPAGFQSVYEALAADLKKTWHTDVRLNAGVTRIQRLDCERDDDGGCPANVIITVNGKKQHYFDDVVITVPLNRVSELVDVSRWERWMFAQVRANRYFVTVFSAADIPTGEALFFYDNAFPEGLNQVGAWGSLPDPSGSFIGTGYQIADEAITARGLVHLLADEVADQGGLFGRALLQKEWPAYFPHVAPLLVKAGYYDAVEALQGKRHTYYTGSSLTFETTEHVARHARDLILKHFSGGECDSSDRCR